MSDKYRETKKNWAILNRLRINAKRRELRIRKKAKKMKGKVCLLCEIRMDYKDYSYGTRLYCKDCNQRYADKVRRHRWQRYYNKYHPKPQYNLKDRRFNPKRVEEMFQKDYMH